MRFNIIDIVTKNKLVTVILVIAAFLRLYRLNEFALFLSDQGRDAIIIKRIVSFEHFPAIGPPTSVGQVFLGPFYYYLMAPFLFISHLDPVGLAYGVSLLSIIGLIASYVIVRKLTDQTTALYFLVFAAFSSVMIEFSRFSWNPNPLPVFAFLTLYFFYQALSTKKVHNALLYGAFFALSIQLHYLAVFLFPTFLVFSIYKLVKEKVKLAIVKNIVASIVSFILFSSPLIFFDLRHGFINSKSLLRLAASHDISSNASYLDKLHETVYQFFHHVLVINPGYTIPFIFFLALGILYIYLVKQKKINLFLGIHFFAFISFIFSFSLLFSYRHPHYYGSIYFSFFLIVASLLTILGKNGFMKYILIPLILITYIFINAQQYTFITAERNHQISHARETANFLADKIGNKPFNIATWPVNFSEDSYLYFLELKGLIPADRRALQITDQMFVLCSEEPCLVIDSPSWNISMFGKAKIQQSWTFEAIKIYKLVHEK